MCIVELKDGKIRGKQEDGYVAFRGIPYAKPPVGKLRWVRPQAVEPWEGVKDCFEFGPACCQCEKCSTPGGDPDDRGILQGTSEDCLYINVNTPDLNKKNQPVFVWIHGGAYCCGSGGGKSGMPETFVKRGIVYVSFNYRVGVMGFFAHPELSAENPEHISGNYGHYDQLAALQWVKENIAKFGGDPNQITIGGSSAGAGSTEILCTSPLAKGLMNRAMFISSLGIESATYPEKNKLSTMEDMEKRGVEFMEKMGAKNINDLRAMSYEQLVSIPEAEFRQYFHYGTAIGSCVDGHLMKRQARQSAELLDIANIPYIGLVANDEGAGHVFRKGKDIFIRQSEKIFGEKTDDYLSRCHLTQDVQSCLDAGAETHLKFAGTKVFAEMSAKAGRAPVYVVDFMHKDPVKKTAYHGLCTQYLFGRFTVLQGIDETDYRTAEVMQEYFCNFIKTGDPNAEGSDLPKWTPYTDSNRKVLYLDADPKVLDDSVAEKPLNRYAREFLEDKLLK